MRLEPEYVAQGKLMRASISAVAILRYWVRDLLSQRGHIVRGLLAALSLFMQRFHMCFAVKPLRLVG